jgi:hypothetical protein
MLASTVLRLPAIPVFPPGDVASDTEFVVMTQGASLLAELEDAVAHGSDERRAKMLRLVTDMFLAGAESYTDDQIDLFDDVIGQLAHDIEVSARAELARRLAPAGQAPIKVLSSLATDNDISVAAPVLALSDHLDDEFLSETARTKSQDHLLAISKRNSLSESVTDILVERGDRGVVHSVASNAGARFSQSGFFTLVRRSEGDDTLAEMVGARSDIPPQVFRELLARASERVRQKLSEAAPEGSDQVPQVLTDITDVIESEAGLIERDYAPAHRRLDPIHRASQLDIAVVESCARAGSFEEVVVGVSFLCGVPIPVVERALVKKDQELFMILAKACRMTWATVKCILIMLSVTRGMPKIDLDRSFEAYNRVQAATAQRVVRFMRVRNTAAR